MGFFDWNERPAQALAGGGVIGPDERLPWGQTGLMGVQHVIAMFGSILVWFFLPWLDKSPVRSGHYRPTFRKFFWFGLIPAMAVLFYCGGAPAAEPYVLASQLASLYYFAHFLIILPIVSSIERPDPLPFSITEAVLGKDMPAGIERQAAVHRSRRWYKDIEIVVHEDRDLHAVRGCKLMFCHWSSPVFNLIASFLQSGYNSR